MAYPTMCCEAETETKEFIRDENNLRTILEDTQKALNEAHGILSSISKNIINIPSQDNDIPKACCLNDQAIINRNMSAKCRDLAMEINTMIFGKG